MPLFEPFELGTPMVGGSTLMIGATQTLIGKLMKELASVIGMTAQGPKSPMGPKIASMSTSKPDAEMIPVGGVNRN